MPKSTENTVVKFRKRTGGAVVEERPATSLQTPEAAFNAHRVRQQEILTELGLLALKGTPFAELLDHTARLTAQKRSDAGRALFQLNELEWVEGELWANVWHTDRIARIDPKTGEVTRFIDLTGLLPATQRRDAESVLTGIAYDPQAKRIFVTGKNWPKLFEIRVKPRS